MPDLIQQLHHYANGECDMTPVGSTLLEAADRIEQLERAHVALIEAAKTWQEDFIQENQRLHEANVKLAKAMETLEQITTIIFSAVQGDNEHGVRSLNEIAAKNYLNDFPLTLAAITQVQDVIDAALAELHDGEEAADTAWKGRE